MIMPSEEAADHAIQEEYAATLQAEEILPRGAVRVDLEERVVDDVRSGRRTFIIVPSVGQAKAPRYVYPPAAIEGDTLHLFAGGARLFPEAVITVKSLQALSMERSRQYGDVAWSQCGRERASFPLYGSEEKALTEMDGWPDDKARFAHYCADGKKFDGHIIRWNQS